MLVMNMSGIYGGQAWIFDALRRGEAAEIDLQNLSGTNAYLDDDAKETIRARLEDFFQNARGFSEADLRTNGIRLLDNGNFHYLSLLFMERIPWDFSLVLFDNHPDMQTARFGNITSCGGWVREALETLPRLHHVFLIGAKDRLVLEEMAELLSDVRSDDGGEPREANAGRAEPGTAGLRDRVTVIGPQGLVTADDVLETLHDVNGGLPLYISVDKDVLRMKDAVCNWEQGVMSLAVLCEMLAEISKAHRVISVDICGETDDLQNVAAEEKNGIATREILRVFGR